MKKTSSAERFENSEFDLWAAIAAIDRKDYQYWDRLTVEQQRKFVPFMMLQWISCLKNNGSISQYYVRSTDYHANMHMFNERVQQHGKLQWLMLCASSPGKGKQSHGWINQISPKVINLKEKASIKDIKEYFRKIYPDADSALVDEMAKTWTETQNKNHYIAERCPNMKLDDISTLSVILSDNDIENHRKETSF